MIDWLSDTLIATSALMVLVLILREPMRTYFGSRTAYALWLLPAARAVMPTLTETVTRTIPSPASSFNPVVRVVTPEPYLLNAVSPAPASLLDALGGWPTILIMVWLGLALGLIARGIGDFTRQRRDILQGSIQLARIGSIRVVRSSGIRAPVAFGLIDRVIAVPDDFDRRYDDRERCLALEHELAHHRHGDLFANFFAFILLSFQWFNPLAWWSYSAFRFDQEAACDARVLDKALPRDRADYGRAIAKAASGRALLLASALDRRNTLQRRLKSMLTITSKRRRLAGSGAIVLAAAAALPLTATHATNYVDVRVSTPVKASIAPNEAARPLPAVAIVGAAAPVVPVSAIAAVAAAEPVRPVRERKLVPDLAMITNDSVQIHGRTVRWDQLTPAERAEVRVEVRKARSQLVKNRADLPRELAQAEKERTKFQNGEYEREIANARVELSRSLGSIDAEAADLRRHGVDPEALKADIRKSLREVETIDVNKIRRDALAEVNPEKMAADLREAEASLDRAESRLDQLDRPNR